MNSYNGFTPKERLAAFKLTKKAWEDGEVSRPSRCEGCGHREDEGVPGYIVSHDEDYSKPYLYYEVCFVCHMMIHCRFGAGQERWLEYLKLLDEGAVFERAYAWPTFRGRFLRGDLKRQVASMGPQRMPSFLHKLPLDRPEGVPPNLPMPERLILAGL